MKILALDLSWTSTGYSVGVHSGLIRTSPQKYPNDMDRARYIVDQIRELFAANGAELVVIEDFALGASRKNSRAHSTGMLGGIVRWELHRESIPFALVPPASLKKYATGKGNAGKPEVLVAAVRRLGYERASNDEADAMWLHEMAMAHYAPDGAVLVPKAHLSALDGVDWPDL